MAVSKVAFDGRTLIDLTGDTATAADVASGKKFHLSNGEQATGTNTGGITPTGTINITANGTHDVTSYAAANVNVPAAQASFARTFTLTYYCTGAIDESLELRVYYRRYDALNPSAVTWHEDSIHGDGGTYTITFNLCPAVSDNPDAFGNAIVDGFYIEGVDGSAKSDITALSGNILCPYVITSQSGYTGTEAYYIIARGNAASIEIYLPN